MRRRLWSGLLLILLCAGTSAGWCSGFPDVPFDDWAYDEIMACVGSGVVAGYDDGLYRPDQPVARDQMAVYIARALAGGDDDVADFTGTPTFPDVATGHWALKYVEYAVDQAVVAGYDDGNYHPEYEVTRDQMAVYVARAMVAPSGEAGLDDYIPVDPRDFPDVDSGFWAYKHVEYCVENGVVSGYDDGLYHPEIIVTRDQMAVYVTRAYHLLSPFAGTYSASYPSGAMTIAVDAVGEATLAIIDDSLGVLAGTGTVSHAGVLSATAVKEGTPVSVGVSGEFVSQAGTVVASGSITGAVSADWTGEKIADLGISAFAGSWSGQYWGAEWGTWEAEIHADGSVTATAQSPSVGTVTLGGTVAPVGGAVLEGSGEGPGGPYTITWEGVFYMEGADAVGEGDWESTSGYWGWWSGERE